jgi:hypothetical protein
LAVLNDLSGGGKAAVRIVKTLVAALVLLIPALCVSLPAHAGVDAADEYEIKAAMFVNLVRLVDWPPGTYGSAASPLVIGVAGSDDMAQALEKIAQSKSAPGTRQIRVKRITGASVVECQSIFVGGGDKKKIQAMLDSLARTPVLTVGEDDRFIALGGMIDLMVRNDRVQIEVNLDVAQTSGLTISSRVLKIAIVRTGGGQ